MIFKGKKINAIGFIFENTDAIFFPLGDIVNVMVSDLSTSISYNHIASGQTDGRVLEMISCKFMIIGLKPDAMKMKTQGWGTQEDDYCRPFGDCFYCDITSVVFEFEDGSNLQVYVPWGDEDYYSIKTQRLILKKNGTVEFQAQKNINEEWPLQEGESIFRQKEYGK